MKQLMADTNIASSHTFLLDYDSCCSHSSVTRAIAICSILAMPPQLASDASDTCMCWRNIDHDLVGACQLRFAYGSCLMCIHRSTTVECICMLRIH